MFSRSILAIGAIVLLVHGAFAQDSKPISADVSKNPVEVRFTDGGQMRMTIADEFLELTTNHGKLKIAVANIRRIELASRLSEAHQKLIEQSIADLSSPQYKTREKATAELIALKEKAYPAVVKISQSSDAEVAKRAKEIIEKIRARVPASRLRWREKDVVYTIDSTITGRIEISGFQANTQQFGPVQLKLPDVLGMHFNAGTEIEVTLDGRYAMNTEAWLDTGVDVTEHVNLTITASGEIDMYATDGYVGQYVGSPRGKKAWPGNTGLPYEPGTLVARIGETGSVFVVKDQYDSFAPASGRLYLRAAGNPYNVKTTGSYSIKISGGIPAVGGAPQPAATPATPNDAPFRKGAKR